jgi:hypothetical protein
MVWNVALHNGVNVKEFIDKWDIHFWGLCATNPQFFEHVVSTSGGRINTNMPSGVTGKYRIDLFLHDSTNDFKARENSDRVMHELSHAFLFGTPHFVKGVHDNVSDRYLISFWYWSGLRYRKFSLTIIDIKRFI